MNAQVTEAHRQAAVSIFELAMKSSHHGAPFHEPCAQLIADSEARAIAKQVEALAILTLRWDKVEKERDQLRAEAGWWKNQHAENQELEDAIAAKVKGTIDALRAEVERLTAACDKFSNAEIAQGDWKARAERAEAELGKLQELHGCSQEMIVHWCEHAAKRSLELDFQVARNSDLFTQRDEAVEAQGKAEAELAAEQARLDWLEQRGPWEAWSDPHEEPEITLRGPIRAAIDAAMKEETK